MRRKKNSDNLKQDTVGKKTAWEKKMVLFDVVFFRARARIGGEEGKKCTYTYIPYQYGRLKRREKSATHRRLLHQETRWSEIERGDITNKGDIVRDADDSLSA